MFCPDCRTEYRPGFAVCSDCGATLVAALSESGDAPSFDGAKDVVLLRTAEHFQADVAEALLSEAGIPFYRRKEIGGELQIPMMEAVSAPTYTSVLYVPEPLLAKAKALLAELPPPDETVVPEEAIRPGDRLDGADEAKKAWAGCLLIAAASGLLAFLAMLFSGWRR